MSRVSQITASALLKIFFWKTEGLHGFYTEEKAVLVMAPHTSMMDFVIGKLVVMKYRRNCKFFIKKEAFSWFLIGPLLKKWGGIPINRVYKNTHVEDAVKEMDGSKQLWIIITPEGTRRKVGKWKSGFYRIAVQAHVPILVSYIDYKKRIATIVAKVYPSGDYESDLKEIMSYTDGASGLHEK